MAAEGPRRLRWEPLTRRAGGMAAAAPALVTEARCAQRCRWGRGGGQRASPRAAHAGQHGLGPEGLRVTRPPLPGAEPSPLAAGGYGASRLRQGPGTGGLRPSLLGTARLRTGVSAPNSGSNEKRSCGVAGPAPA